MADALFETLLYPTTPEAFAPDYWARKPLLIRGGAAKLERMFPEPQRTRARRTFFRTLGSC
jgi:ribosomal protein L16 Arg81 hydroxylase